MGMKQVLVRFDATFEVTLEVDENATREEIGDALADFSIPSTKECRYVEDTFAPACDPDGNPKLFV